MIKKIKDLITENRNYHKKQIKLLKELEWAHVYHDSIKGLDFIENLQLNIGRWAGSYAFFYILNRILLDYKPQRILEFGLGESSKFISSYLDHFLKTSSHLIIEQDSGWHKAFNQRFTLSDNSEVVICPMIKKEVKGFEVNQYDGLVDHISETFDLYIVDGPIGSDRYSRYDIVDLAKKIKNGDEFIIIFDDCNRDGEKDTVADLLEVFKTNQIPIIYSNFEGGKTVTVIATMKYRFVKSL